jgi:hypothetical protein
MFISCRRLYVTLLRIFAEVFRRHEQPGRIESSEHISRSEEAALPLKSAVPMVFFKVLPVPEMSALAY